MLTEIFNELGTEIMPSVFNEIATDTLNILRVSSPTSDGGGGVRKGTQTAINTSPIPCLVEIHRGLLAQETAKADRRQNKTFYLIKFCLTENGSTPLSVLPSDRLQVLARGLIAERIFEIIGINDNGVHYELICTIET